MIGIFDSGIGGLTVLRVLMENFPGYDLIYFGDTARAPYGTKSPRLIIDYTIENIEYIINLGANIILLACHTAAGVARDTVRSRFAVPLIDVIVPAVQRALKISRHLRIGVIGTPATIMSDAYQKEIHNHNPAATVYAAACPILVPLIEENWRKKPETKTIVKKCLHPLKVRQIDTLILGCGHYGLLAKIIQAKIGKRVSLIDPSACVVDRIQFYLAEHPETENLLRKNNRVRLILSDVTAHIEKLTRMILKKNVPIETGRP